MTTIRKLAATALTATIVSLAACGGTADAFGPDAGDLAAIRGNDGAKDSSGTGNESAGNGADDLGRSNGGSGSIGTLRIRCELRTSGRSKISVDGKNLPAGSYSAQVRSGGNSATSGLKASVGDEVEFDFDSARDDIRAGATPISSDFIQTSGSPDVTARILSAAGDTVLEGGADCEVRD